MAPYLLFGYILAGILHILIPEQKLSNILRGKTGPIKASLIGVPLPICSCGVIPLAAHLEKNGVKKSAILSFIISTPTTGIESIFATYSLLGPIFALLRPLIAFITGISTGSFYMFITKDYKKEPVKEASTAYKKKIKPGQIISKIFTYAFFDLVESSGKWIIIGIIVGGIITTILPSNLYLMKDLGIFSYPIILIISIPLYICATGSIPIAAALIQKGFSLGAAFLFLFAGPATNTATLSFVLGKLGKKTFLLYILSILLFGTLGGIILDSFNIKLNTFTLHMHNKETSILSHISAILIGVLILRAIFIKTVNKMKKQDVDMKFKLHVPDITCKHCKLRIEKALSTIKGINNIEIDIDKKTVFVDADEKTEKTDIIKAIENEGYTVKDENT